MQDRAQRAAEVFLPDRSLYYYARCKMRWDPVYDFLARKLVTGADRILDLGCGAGVLAAWLRESGIHADYDGVELAEAKTRAAIKSVGSCYAGTRFRQGDAAEVAETGGLPSCVLALDLLHYFSTRDQQNLLNNLARGLPPGGRLFLRNGVNDAVGWRHAITTAEEGFVRLSKWISGGEWNFPSRAQVEETLREAGLAVVAVPMWGRTPFSSYLFVAAKRSAG